MKKTLLFIFASVAVSLTSMAQCSPNPAFTTPGFYPDSATGLPVACNGVLYSEVITMVSPVDTTVNTPFGIFTIPVDSVTIIGVTGLASGLSSTCQLASCTWYPSVNPASCLLISGTPSASGTTSFVIEYQIYVTIFGSAQFLSENQGYSFEVQGCAGLTELPYGTKEVLKVTDLMGRETSPAIGIPMLYHYSDGTVQRIVNLGE